MKVRALRGLAVAMGAGTLLIATPGVASAHPLGNFTVNRFSGVVVSANAVTVDHVLDIAEVPTTQRRPEIDTSGDREMSRPELAAWAAPSCATAAKALHLSVGEERVPLAVASAGARALPGQAGLPVLRLECSLRAPLGGLGESTRVLLVDTAGDGEVGWKEMTGQGDGTTLTESDVPASSRSDRLLAYPESLLSDPLDVRSADLTVRAGGPTLAATGNGTTGSGQLDRGVDRLTAAFEGLLQRADDGPLLGLLALLGAVALGAAHAVAPGHGKTIMAFYLSGRRQGSLRAAVAVGATVTATHTAGVLALGALAGAGTALAPAEVYPWLSVAAGLLVVAVGLSLLRSARHGAPGHSHGTGPGQHTHEPPLAPIPAPAARELVATSVATDPATAVGLSSPAEVPMPPEHPQLHEHPGQHQHQHQHPHEHPHPHEHDRETSAQHTHERADLSPRGLVAIGLAGGLLPSPSAILVFLGALALGKPWFGVALVIAFGIGMAGTLAGVGLLVMRLRLRAEQRLALGPRSRFAPLLRAVPVITAVSVVLLGAALAVRGLGSTGVI